MARARNIKPGFFSNDDLVELSFETRLLFIGLWTIADRAGRLLDRPKKIKMDVFPGDNVDVEASLAALAASGFIARYESLGVRAIQISNWAKHQNPHVKEAPSTIPFQGQSDGSTVDAPCESGASTVQASEIPERAGLIPDSLNLIPDSGLPSEAPAKRKPDATATRLPADWAPNDADIVFCKTERADLSVDATASQFRDYWIAQPGAKGRKTDWPATWRNWVRNQRAPQARAGPPGYQTANDKAKTLADRLTGKTRNDATFDFIDIN